MPSVGSDGMSCPLNLWRLISHPSRWCQHVETGGRAWGSVVLGEQDRAGVSQPQVVHRLGDDPELLPLPGLVGAEDATAIHQGGVVEALVLVIEVAPVA